MTKRRRVRVPLYMSIRKCADIAGCHHTTMRRWASLEGLLVMVGGRHRISTDRLKKTYPEIYERVADEAYENG